MLLSRVYKFKLMLCLSVCPSVYLPVCLSVYLPVCLSVYLPVCLSVCPSACLSVCLSVCLSICRRGFSVHVYNMYYLLGYDSINSIHHLIMSRL